MDAVSDGENREYGRDLLMESGTKAVSGWRVFEQTECPQETTATSYQHTHLVKSREFKKKKKKRNTAWKPETGTRRGYSTRENCRWGDMGGGGLKKHQRAGWSRDALCCKTAVLCITPPTVILVTFLHSCPALNTRLFTEHPYISQAAGIINTSEQINKFKYIKLCRLFCIWLSIFIFSMV